VAPLNASVRRQYGKRASMRLFTKITALITLLILSGCASEIGSFDVEGESQPRFIFDTKHVGLLLVYRTPRKYLNGGVPLSEFFQNDQEVRLGLKNNPNIQWAIEGDYDGSRPITYGSLPEGMKEIVPAKLLAANTAYVVCAHIGRSAYSFAGRTLIIRDGKTIQVYDYIDENSVKN
jgi:hypothetical protein